MPDAKTTESRSWFARLTTARRSRTVAGVRYEPRRVRIDGKRGFGYTVQFPDGQRMRITPHANRTYADLDPCPRLEAARALHSMIIPGSRLLDLGCGTGASADELARVAGPAGCVLAIHDDAEAIRFARRRYGAAPIAFERGGMELLSGEPDGAFDAVLVDAAWLSSDAPAREIARVVARPGDVFIMTGPEAPAPAAWPAASSDHRAAAMPKPCWTGDSAALLRIRLNRPSARPPGF